MRAARGSLRLRAEPAKALIDSAEHPSGLTWNPDGQALPRNVWIEHRWLLAIAGLHVMVLAALSGAGLTDFTLARIWERGVIRHLVLIALLWLPFLLLLDFIRLRSVARVQRRYLTARSVAGMLIGCSFVTVESQIHRTLKQVIGESNPFRWDRTLSDADAWLHFGVAPWRLLDRIFHPASLTSGLDTAYWLWFPLMIGAGCCFAWLPERRTRARAFITWGLAWILLGTGLAQAMASAGPAFFHLVSASPDPYGPLREHLQAVNGDHPLMALAMQASLWNSRGAHGNAWNGISAMPSMHIAIPALMAIALFRPYRAFAILMWGYVVLVWCGSIYLGWHYAVDGYVSLLGVAILWWMSDRILGSSSLTDAR